jgi:sugar phosphate isomerase/epimerase
MVMKYSFMSFSTPELDLAAVLDVARRIGYDGIEPRLDSGHAHGIEVGLSRERCDAVRAQAADAGIELACLATSLKFADPAATETVLAQTRERIDLAGNLGVKTVRVFGGKIPDGIEREQAIDQVARCLAAVADQAEARGVTLCLETHDDWCDPRHVAAVMLRVGQPGIAVNWDIMHPVRTGKATIGESFETLRPWIRHVHVHDGVGRELKMVPIGTGEIDHRSALACLAAAEYGGFISGEWIRWEPYATHLPRELETLKRYERAARGG